MINLIYKDEPKQKRDLEKIRKTGHMLKHIKDKVKKMKVVTHNIIEGESRQGLEHQKRDEEVNEAMTKLRNFIY